MGSKLVGKVEGCKFEGLAEDKEEWELLYSKDIGGLCMARWCRNKVAMASGVCGREASAAGFGCK